MSTPPELGEDRIDEVLELLGLTDRPSIDAAGLHTVYSAWCRSIPFDNLSKLTALGVEGAALPGIRPDEFFSTWEADGTGGTCWATNNALHALLHGVGFEATRRSASMFDGAPNHGTTIVAIDDERWIVDTAIHGDVPAPLVDGVTTTVSHAGYPTTVRHDPDGPILDHPTPDPEFSIPCRILAPMTFAESVEANERTRTWSPFNTGIMAGINDDTGVWMLKDTSLTRVEETGPTTRTLTPTEVDEFLVDVVGCSPRIVALVRTIT